MRDHSIVVVGSGLTAMTFVIAAMSLGYRVTMLEKESLVSLDERPISLNYVTKIFFENIELWPLLAPHAAPILRVHVSEQGRLGSLLLSADDCKQDALGYVIPYHFLDDALCQKLMRFDAIQRIVINDISHIQEADDAITLEFTTAQGKQTLTAGYLIAADGAHSACRSLLGIQATEVSHQNVALTALLQCEHPHQHTAYERFTPYGICALLPMGNIHHMRLVWTMADHLLATLTESERLAIVNAAFRTRIGSIISCEWQGYYPLKTVMAKQQVTQRAVLLGDSAHRLSPLTAQGYNLTVRDIAMLMDVLHDQKPLADYVRQRTNDQKFAATFIKNLDCIFGLQLPVLNVGRAIGLGVLDCIPFAKRWFIRQLLGQVGRQPRLLCRE